MVASYKEMKTIAGNLGDWAGRQKTIVARLTQKEEYGLLTRIYLLETDLMLLNLLAKSVGLHTREEVV